MSEDGSELIIDVADGKITGFSTRGEDGREHKEKVIPIDIQARNRQVQLERDANKRIRELEVNELREVKERARGLGESAASLVYTHKGQVTASEILGVAKEMFGGRDKKNFPNPLDYCAIVVSMAPEI